MTLCDQAAIQEGSSGFSHWLLHRASHSLFQSYISCLTLEMLTQARFIIRNISTGTPHWRTADLTLFELPTAKRLPNPRRDYVTVWFWSNLHHSLWFFQTNFDTTVLRSACEMYADHASSYCCPRISRGRRRYCEATAAFYSRSSRIHLIGWLGRWWWWGGVSHLNPVSQSARIS